MNQQVLNPEMIVQYMTQKIQSSRRPGTLFPVAHLAQQFGQSPQVMEQALESLEGQSKVHKVGRDNWGLGGNPWGKQRRQKIFRCQHCGSQNTVDITGD